MACTGDCCDGVTGDRHGQVAVQQLNWLHSSCTKLFWFVHTAGLSTLTMEYIVCSTTSGISVKCVARAFQLAISVLDYVLLIFYV